MNISQYRTLITIDYRKVCFTLLTLMYLAGIIGLLLPITQPFFKSLSPLNLWFSLALLLSFHRDFNKSFITIAVIIFLSSLMIEMLGVHTGVIFGKYWYGQTLGTQVLNVPLVIGANWLLLIYCSSITTQMLIQTITKKLPAKFQSVQLLFSAFCSALMMVMLDFLIEPVAIRLDFWYWQNEQIPNQNYLMWFLLSFFLSYIFFKGKFLKNNPLAFLLLVLQFSFFLIINLFFFFS
jgi:uncharacterized membrane protein